MFVIKSKQLICKFGSVALDVLLTNDEMCNVILVKGVKTIGTMSGLF